MLRAPPSPDPKVSVEFIDRQLARDNLYVQFKLGRMLLKGGLYPADRQLGFSVSRLAAERGYGPACLFLAMDFYSGKRGLPKRMDLWAFYWRMWKTRPKRARTLRSESAVVIPFDRERRGMGN